MHTAPAVDYPVGRSLWHAVLLVAIGLALTLVYVTWFTLADLISWRHWLGLSLAVAAMLAACRVWWSAPAGSLGWDGQAWWWESHDVRVSGTVAPALDLQFVVLLRFHSHAGARHWFWLERSSDPLHWDDLRRAVADRRQDVGDAGDDVSTVRLPRRRGTSIP